MHNPEKSCQKLEVDWNGDLDTDEITEVRSFIGVMTCRQYAFVCRSVHQ